MIAIELMKKSHLINETVKTKKKLLENFLVEIRMDKSKFGEQKRTASMKIAQSAMMD